MYSIEKIRSTAIERINKLKYDEYSKISVIKDITEEETLHLIFDDKMIFTRKYDMEQCREVIPFDGSDWSFCLSVDPEWAYMSNRMDYVYDLVRYAIENDDVRYAKKALAMIFSWIDYHGDNLAKNPHSRTLDTGIRLLAWIDSLEWLIYMDLITNDELATIIDSMLVQINYLKTNFAPFQNLSNWGLVQAAGALAAITFTGYEGELVEYNESLLAQHIAIEFYNDGFHWELSSLYSMEVISKLVTLRYEKMKTIEYYDLLERAGEALYAIMTTDGKTIMNGDGDEIDCRGLLQMIYIETKSPKIATFLDGTVCEEIFWYKGFDAICILNSIDNSMNKYYKYFDDGKFICYKDYKRGTYLSMQNSLVGGGHGHFDNLHINYNYNHKRILIDAGRGTYVHGAVRRRLKEPEYHNTICVPEYSFEYADSWNNNGTISQFGIENKKINESIFAEATYMPHVNTMARRKMIHLFNEVLIIVDDTNGVDFCSKFHFDRELTLVQNDDNIRINDELKFETHFSTEVSIGKKEVAYHYNAYDMVDCITVNGDRDADHLVSFIVPHKYNIRKMTDAEFEYVYPRKVIDSKSDLFEITFDDHKYVVIIKSKYSGNIDNVVRVNDVVVYGSIIVLDCQTNKFETLKY